MIRKNRKAKTQVIDVPEQNQWDSGFSAFKRRIGEQLQLNDMGSVDDEDLLPFYRMGESEIYVLSALGCSIGI